MTSPLRAAFASAVLCFTVACDERRPAPTDDELGGESASDGEAGKADGVDTFTFLRIERDLRKCIAPLCGGWFASRVNRSATLCADGTWQDRCYVAELDFASSGLSEAQGQEVRSAGEVLLRGEIGAFTHESFGTLGRLHVAEAWLGGTADPGEGLFTKVTDSGLVCFAAPCFGTLREAKLNSVLWANMSELDLSWTELSDEQASAAHDHVYADDGLIVAGYRYWFWHGGWQAGRVATQVYTRMIPAPATDECVTAPDPQACLDGI